MDVDGDYMDWKDELTEAMLGEDWFETIQRLIFQKQSKESGLSIEHA
ncbi:MAG: hypothetical protein LBD23_05090 [Oscillospiraceae bacterium]|jgi:hypothetical protein|nr:hypothetical protein [Oscillospiraceae bacterium]